MRDSDLRQAPGGAVHLVEVHQRLAHPHEDEMVDRLDAPEMKHLVQDLRRGQIAAEGHRAGGAEGAGQRTARLRRDADGPPPVAVAHQHRLDGVPVRGAEERLHGAVAGAGLGHEIERRERNALVERLAQRARHVGHVRVAGGAARHPGPHLAGAERRLAACGELLLEPDEVHPLTVASRL